MAPRLHPALEVSAADLDLLLAAVDDFSPTAVEERGDRVRIFFAGADARDAAQRALAGRFPAQKIDVSDEDWARRSQENLQPVTVGKIVVVPHVDAAASGSCSSFVRIAIPPSMGFGTGHHATTRLCLDALQRIDVSGGRVLDVGTGSGVLAIAAGRLGACEAIGIDVDPDAIHAARENLTFNADVGRVRFEVRDLAAAPLPPSDVVLANLTGALLVRAAATLRAAVVSGGVLVVSGLLAHERDEVVGALGPGDILWEREEDGWLGIALRLDEKSMAAD